jgi:alpha/beta superfamily hydrolase
MNTADVQSFPRREDARLRVRSLDFAGPAGKLEAVLNEGSPDAPYAALVCHPHPKGGGTLHNKVVYHAMKVLNAPPWGFGFPVLRFNFRGTGRSEGAHHGKAEADDVRAALHWLENEYRKPLVVAGFSFGAAMALLASCRGGVKAIAALGLPTRAEGRSYHYSFLQNCVVPKLFLSGSRDRFATEEELAQVVATASDPKFLTFIPDADHFFTGHLEPMQSALARWLKEQLS